MSLTAKQIAAGWKEVPIPDCYAPPPVPASSSAHIDKRVQVRMQTEEARDTHHVTCRCRTRMQIHRAYKCLYCGEWYCATCAEIHFGMTRAEWQAQKQNR